MSDSSYKIYNTALKKWFNYCLLHKVDLFTASISDVLSFLTAEFNNGLSYSSINSTRSALSLIIKEDIGEDDRIKRFFKGIANSRPSRAKYDVTWDPQIVLDYFRAKESNKILSFKDLSYKTITLLALITGHRMQTFSLIDIRNIVIKGSQVEIKISAKIKTSRKNTFQPNLILPFFSEEKLCAASAIVNYLEKTKNFRGPINQLFVSLNKPTKPVSSQTLGHWVKEILALSGIDTSIFSAHSTRHASTSKAKSLGVDLGLIRKTAGWSENSVTFAKFYDRKIISDKQKFALSILNNSL